MGKLLSFAAPLAFAVGTLVASSAVSAQVSREVVQELPPPAQDDLNDALRRLGRNANDAAAALDAGMAWLALGDARSAKTYLEQAQRSQPGAPRVLAGLGAVAVRQGDPVGALVLFDRAEQAGSVPDSLVADRALAYDLVGDNARAQSAYRLALATNPSDEVRRQLAISQAIGGDLAASEATLLPLLQKGDRPAFRSRAFVLAIHGELDEAMTIAQAILPPAAARQIRPYFDAMPRLTRSQQAAAANLGVFPERGQLGEDPSQIAALSNDAAPQAIAQIAREDGSGDRLVPRGQPFGSASASGPALPPTVQAVGNPEPATTPSRTVADAARGELPPLEEGSARQVATDQVVVAPAPPRRAVEVGRATRVAVRPATRIELPPQQTQATPVEETDTAAPGPALQTPSEAAARPASQPVSGRVPGTFDLARIDPTDSFSPASAGDPAPEQSSRQQARSEPASIADAFSDFALASGPVTPATGAVDITAISIPRETRVEPKPERPAPPPPAADPSRVWVQVATGQDVSALAFDWRRLSRKAPDLLGDRDGFTASWGQTNRLVTGPLASVRAANELVAALKAAGVDSFRFTSAAGEAVTPLP